jgi:hypothetical protein
MRARLSILIALGLLMAGSLQLWLQFPNHFSDHLTRWQVQAYKDRTGTTSVPIPVDMSPRLWPKVVGMALLLGGAGFFVAGLRVGRRCSPRSPPP